MKIQKSYGSSVLGSCVDCGRVFDDYNNRKQGYNHAKKTGHKVLIEITTNYIYN